MRQGKVWFVAADPFSGVRPRVGHAGRDGVGPGRAQAARHVPGPAERDPGQVQADERRLRPRQARRDDPHARRREAAHGHPDSRRARSGRRSSSPGRPTTPTSSPSHAESAHLGPVLNGYDNATGRDPRGGLHPRRAGRPRQARLRGGLRRQPAPARPAEPDARRSRDRHVGHHRLAGEERPREQRQGRHPGDLVRRLPAADGARRSAPGAQGVGADEPDGRRLDRRRLVPLRRLPPDQRELDLQPGRHAQVGGEVVDEPPRRVRHVHAGGLGRRAGSPPRPRSARASGRSSPSTPPTTPSGATRPWTSCWRSSR